MLDTGNQEVIFVWPNLGIYSIWLRLTDRISINKIRVHVSRSIYTECPPAVAADCSENHDCIVDVCRQIPMHFAKFA